MRVLGISPKNRKPDRFRAKGRIFNIQRVHALALATPPAPLAILPRPATLTKPSLTALEILAPLIAAALYLMQQILKS